MYCMYERKTNKVKKSGIRLPNLKKKKKKKWCGVAHHRAAWLSMVRRGSVWCGVAQNDAAWLRMVRRGSVWCGVAKYGAAWLSMVWRGSLWCGEAHNGAPWLSMVQRGSVGSASASNKAGPSLILGSAVGTTGRFFPLSLPAMKRWRETSANGDGKMCIVRM
jgi:hypothetical protein